MRSVLNDGSRWPLAVLGVVLMCVAWCEGQTGEPLAAEAPEVEATRRFQAHAKDIAAAHALAGPSRSSAGKCSRCCLFGCHFFSIVRPFAGIRPHSHSKSCNDEIGQFA